MSRPEQSENGVRDEGDLMKRVAEGDLQAYGRIVDRYWGRIMLHARHLTGDVDRAHDVAQEVFSRLWKHRSEWRDGSVSVWLHRTARNLIAREQRRSVLHQRWEAIAAGEDLRPRTPHQAAESEEIRAAVHRAIEELSPRRREVITLFHMRDLSYREIAEIMEIRPQSVANHLQAALQQLRASLGRFFPDAGK